MNQYSLFNVALSAIILPISLWLNERRWKLIGITARISTLMVLFVYPWDFFAIHLHVWDYPHDPGLRLYEVPLNDLMFTWLCTQLAASVLFRLDRRQAQGRGHSEREHADEQYTG